MVLREVKQCKFNPQIHERYIAIAINSEDNFFYSDPITKEICLFVPLWHITYSKFFIMSLLPENKFLCSPPIFHQGSSPSNMPVSACSSSLFLRCTQAQDCSLTISCKILPLRWQKPTPVLLPS